MPYSAVVLHFSREEPGHLLAADLIQVHGPEGEFVLQRHMLNGTTNRDEHFGPAPPPARAGQPKRSSTPEALALAPSTDGILRGVRHTRLE